MHADFDFYPIAPLVQVLEAGRTVLTPNHRLARRIKLAWGRYQVGQERNAWSTPKVMSLEHWWLHCYHQRELAGDDLPALASAAQEQALWLECVRDSGAALLRPATAASLARDAYRNLLLWGLDWREEAVAQQFRFGEDSRLFLEWAGAFEERLETLGLTLLPRCIPHLAETCQMSGLVLAEFGELPPLYREALAVQAGDIDHIRAGQRHADASLAPCDSHRGELEAAARWAFENFQNDPRRRIGILLPGLQQERQTMERLLRTVFDSDPRDPDSLPVNFSAGVPMADCGPVRAALGLLALPVEDLGLAELGQLLQTRYRHGAERLLDLEAWRLLLEDAREPVSPGLLRHRLGRVQTETGAPPALLQLLVRLADGRALRRKRLPSAWSEEFRSLLGALGWPGPGPLDSLEYQQVEQFHAQLASFGELDVVLGDLDYRGALAALQQQARDAVFQAQTADAPVQVLGLLEAAGLQFDALWVCNMSAGEWPQPARPNPFIPVSLQRRERMPHADANRELEYAQQLLTHLRQSCSEMVFSYARLDDDASVAPSPLVAEEPAEAVRPDRAWPEHWPQAQAGGLERKDSISAPPVSAGEAETIKGGSAILGNQARCPFRAFATHRLNARPLPAPQVALTPAERGAILHDAMHHLWESLQSSEALAATPTSERETLCRESAAVAVEAFRQRGGARHPPILLELEQQRLGDLMLQWLEVEEEREAFRVAALEQRHEFALGPLTITLRIDRIDELEDGRKLVIDYKSSDSRPRLWLGERPEDPQLPLYSQLLATDEVEGISFAVIRQSALEYRGLSGRTVGPGVVTDIPRATKDMDPPLEDWGQLKAHWERVLTGLGQAFLDGRAEVDPIDRRHTCEFCGLEALCRVE